MTISARLPNPWAPIFRHQYLEPACRARLPLYPRICRCGKRPTCLLWSGSAIIVCFLDCAGSAPHGFLRALLLNARGRERHEDATNNTSLLSDAHQRRNLVCWLGGISAKNMYTSSVSGQKQVISQIKSEAHPTSCSQKKVPSRRVSM